MRVADIDHWVVLFCALLASGCSREAGKQPESDAAVGPAWFSDATDELKLDFVHDSGPVDGEYFMPQINGSGAALFDFNNDGRLDIYLLQFGGPESKARNALFAQLDDGTFANVSADSGLDIGGYNHGVAAGDVNNDGWIDLVVTQYEGIRLFLNQGDGTFADATERADLTNPYWGASASFLDYDRDGWLDLVVVNYLVFDKTRHCAGRAGRRDYCLPNAFPRAPTRLFRNRGATAESGWQGFEDRTTEAGLNKLGPGMGTVCADFSGDHWPDIFVANDLAANHLWVNQHDGTFREEAAQRGLAHNSFGATESNMGTAYGDVDHDGRLDLLVTHFTNENHGLWKQSTTGLFQEQSIAAGLSRCEWHGTAWGAALADFDLDGSLDIALVNGFVQRRDAPSDSFWDDYRDRNQLFANDGTGHFQDISSDNPDFCGRKNVARGLCVGDIDGDGRLDLLVTSIGERARIFKNVAPRPGHWLMVRAYDGQLHRDAIGAEVHVMAGNRNWNCVVQPCQSYQCSNDSRVHVGLGTADRVDTIEVIWPDGMSERFDCPSVDLVLQLERGRGTPVQINQEPTQ
jgi:hypothetical protein